MNTFDNVYTFGQLEKEVPIKKTILNKSCEKKYNISYVIKDNDTFDIEFFESQNEKEILDKWMNKIGKSICIEDVFLEVDEELKKCIENEFERNLPISQYDKDELNKVFQEIIQLCNLRKNINKYKLKYSKNTADIAKKCNFYPTSANFQIDPNDIAKNGLKTKSKDITRTCIKEESIYNHITQDTLTIPSQLHDINARNEAENYTLLCNAFPEKRIPETPKNLDKMIIVLHEESLFTFVVENPTTEEYNIVKNKRFGFQLKFEANIEDTMNSIMNKLFNEKCFESLIELDKEIETMNVLINKNASDFKDIREKKQVEKFIHDNYEVNNNVGDKMKASELCTLIEENFQTLGICVGNIIAFRNRLSKYLLDIGLQKKRFGDGFYYYGLKGRFNGYKNIDLKDDNVIENLMKERQQEFEKFNKN